jgi:DNA-binding Lrp family transcriptional regulator
VSENQARTGPAIDDLDREIINRIQVAVPLAPRPFAVLASALESTEDEVVRRIRRLWDEGVVRRLGPILDYASWGMSGVLVAAKVDGAQTERVRQVLGEFPEITHAYLRQHEWNLWFTVIAENQHARLAIIERVTARAGLSEVKELPMKKTYKLGVNFSL